MLDPLQHIADLSELCYRFDVSYVVISPGSRNAPLIDAFSRRFGLKCYSIVDERSAAYFGLGLARESRKPVVLLCTSGTAVLNYAPALAEAYYQHIQLIAITADRPAEWIDQQDNQTIRQPGIYRNFIRKGISLPEKIADTQELERIHSQINEVLNASATGSPGPVHINVPLHEPLYAELPPASEISPGKIASPSTFVPLPEEFLTQWDRAERILLLHGQDIPDEGREQSLKELSTDKRLVIIAENLSNFRQEDVINHPELLLAHISSGELPVPDLLLYAGGQLVSKKIKSFLRTLKMRNTWRIGQDDFEMDTFRQQNRFLPLPAIEVYRNLSQRVQSGEGHPFKKSWLDAYRTTLRLRDRIMEGLPFSDLSLVDRLIKKLPEDAIAEFGNSSPVRYSQLAEWRADLTYYANRGVSGIDGCLSTASGTAVSAQKLCFVMLGDLSFVYDSNALWNRAFPANLRIVVLNNQGGGIFGLIEGPGKKKSFEDFFIAHHPVSIQKLAEAFNLSYFCIHNAAELDKLLPLLIRKSERAILVEVHTERQANEAAFNRIMGRTRDPEDK